MKLYHEMSSRVKVGCKVNGVSTVYRGFDDDGANTENCKIMF